MIWGMGNREWGIALVLGKYFWVSNVWVTKSIINHEGHEEHEEKDLISSVRDTGN